MANKKSAIKELRKSKKRKAHNDAIASDLKLLSKNSRKAIEKGDKNAAEELLGKTLKALDKAAQKGISKDNTKDRRKSRLHHSFNKAFASK
jgi:small subunit ribosomal protein S20